MALRQASGAANENAVVNDIPKIRISCENEVIMKKFKRVLPSKLVCVGSTSGAANENAVVNDIPKIRISCENETIKIKQNNVFDRILESKEGLT